MTTAADAETRSEPLPPIAVRNVAALSGALSLLGANYMVNVALSPLAATLLAPSPAWITAPLALIIITNAVVAAPLSYLTVRYGRRPGFLFGVACALLGSLLAAYAIVIGSFWLFMAASIGFGIYQACQNLFRFAATDAAPAAFKPKAMSYVLAGGLAAAFVAPVIANGFADLLAPTPFAGAYLALAGLNLIGAAPLLFLRRPANDAAAQSAAQPERSLFEALRDRGVGAAMLCGAVAYGAMTLMMSSTAPAMVGCGHAPSDAVLVISAHVLAMFGPSFFTGSLIQNFGQRAVILVGLALMAASVLAAQTGLGLAPFSAALILMGVGWNFAFIGASTLLEASHRDEDRGRVQGANEFFVFGFMAIAAIASGGLLNALGWSWVTLSILPLLALAAMAVIRLLPNPAAQA